MSDRPIYQSANMYMMRHNLINDFHYSIEEAYEAYSHIFTTQDLVQLAKLNETVYARLITNQYLYDVYGETDYRSQLIDVLPKEHVVYLQDVMEQHPLPKTKIRKDIVLGALGCGNKQAFYIDC